MGYFHFFSEFAFFPKVKPLSVTTNVVGLQTDKAGHVGRNSSAYVTHVVGLQTDAVVVTEPRLKRSLEKYMYYVYRDLSTNLED